MQEEFGGRPAPDRILKVAQALRLGVDQCERRLRAVVDVVTQEEGLAEAVLLRGAEPLRGIESMRERRPKAKRDHELMNGPGKICQALDVDKRLDGESLSGDTLWLTGRDIKVSDADIAVSPRIGVDNDALTSELNTAFLAPAKGEHVYCTARILKMGRRRPPPALPASPAPLPSSA